jgi:geranylgeranyl diphosphate synthase type II
MKIMNEIELQKWRNNWVERLNLELKEAITGLSKGEPKPVANLLAAMNYTIESGGKRLRALLTLASAEAVGGEEIWALPGALAVELIHAYSLIHDDLPTLDNDDLRRGRPTCHLVYGEATALLAGDALQSLAFEILALASAKEKNENSQKTVRALHILAQSVGPLGMVGGQAMDLAFEGVSTELDQVLLMEEKKTGWLLGACLALGATMGGADSDIVDQLNMIGRQIGLAFQITDDLLNIIGDPKRMGKNVGTDAQKAKASVVAVISQTEASKRARFLIAQALAMIEGLGSEKLNWLLKAIIDRSS